MAATAGQQKCVKWPDASEYTDKYISPSKMPTKPDPWTSLVEMKNDMLSGRPRTPNKPYTILTEQQLKNMKKNAAPFFMHEDSGSRKDAIILPASKDRYATNSSQYLFRDNPSRSHPHCWIGDKWQREPPNEHSTCRLGASLRWGPCRTGNRTISHFHGENVHRYLNIDMYKRSPTNLPSVVVMKYGRPSEGYYQQRNPNFNTWYGSTHHLNETDVLTNIQPKTLSDYEKFRNGEQNFSYHLASKWPEISEYTDKYLLRTKDEVQLNEMEARKQFH